MTTRRPPQGIVFLSNFITTHPQPTTKRARRRRGQKQQKTGNKMEQIMRRWWRWVTQRCGGSIKIKLILLLLLPLCGCSSHPLNNCLCHKHPPAQFYTSCHLRNVAVLLPISPDPEKPLILHQVHELNLLLLLSDWLSRKKERGQ